MIDAVKRFVISYCLLIRYLFEQLDSRLWRKSRNSMRHICCLHLKSLRFSIFTSSLLLLKWILSMFLHTFYFFFYTSKWNWTINFIINGWLIFVLGASTSHLVNIENDIWFMFIQMIISFNYLAQSSSFCISYFNFIKHFQISCSWTPLFWSPLLGKEIAIWFLFFIELINFLMIRNKNIIQASEFFWKMESLNFGTRR